MATAPTESIHAPELVLECRDARLPDPIRRHLQRNLLDRTALPSRVRLTQEGEMWMKPGGRPLEFEATQEFAVDEVAFRWRARFPLAPLVWLDVEDDFEAGRGMLEARLWGRVPLIRGAGAQLDESEAMRYLAEIPWAPHALLGNPALEWRAVGSRTVELSTLVGSVSAAVFLHCDAAGDIVGVCAPRRPRMAGRKTVPTPWEAGFGAYEIMGGVRIPTHAEARWELPERPFTYFRATVTSFELL